MAFFVFVLVGSAALIWFQFDRDMRGLKARVQGQSQMLETSFRTMEQTPYRCSAYATSRCRHIGAAMAADPFIPCFNLGLGVKLRGARVKGIITDAMIPTASQAFNAAIVRRCRSLSIFQSS